MGIASIFQSASSNAILLPPCFPLMRNHLETAAVIMVDSCRIWWPSTAVTW